MNNVLSFIQDVLAMLATPEGQKVVHDLEVIAGIVPPAQQASVQPAQPPQNQVSYAYSLAEPVGWGREPHA